MRDILRSTDPTLIAFAEAMLAGEGIAAFVLDVHMSTLEGGIGALPRRLAVADEDAHEARQVLRDLEINPHEG